MLFFYASTSVFSQQKGAHGKQPKTRQSVSPHYYKVKVTLILVFHYKLLLHDKILILNQYKRSSTAAAKWVGSLTFQSPMFVQYFKVLKETHIQMALALITMQL